MEILQIYSATLGLAPPWKITAIEFDGERQSLNISVEPRDDAMIVCPDCGSTAFIRYLDTGTRTWCHRDFLSYTTYLHARIPYLGCRCGITPVELPWCRPGSLFVPHHEPPEPSAGSRETPGSDSTFNVREC